MPQGKERAGYACWLSYREVKDAPLRQSYLRGCSRIAIAGDSPILRSARDELVSALQSMLGATPQVVEAADETATLVVGTVGSHPLLRGEGVVSEEGYAIRRSDGGPIALAANTDRGALYAVFHFLALLQEGESIERLDIAETPANRLRMINHWDNMDGSIERGYAGRSIFFRDDRFDYDLSRVRDYARLLASVGLNAVSINNVNVHRTETKLITEELLPDVAKVADIFRAYGIRLFLSVNYASPIEIGGLGTADPLDPAVGRWWKERAETIYRYVPDFGGFVVKADSEFRPGPFSYGRNHAEGANMLADALAPHGGIVVWRCFVYNCLQDWRDRKTDRARAAYDHFMPLDGQFRDNVILQIKNGPMDFQVREPVSPLLGGLASTNQLLELQITQEYTGQQRHLCYLVSQWKEVLDFDTYARGEESTVSKVASGTLFERPIGGMAAVSNIGDDDNWTGHPLAQANWYGFGRLAWDPSLAAERIAKEWIARTFGGDPLVMRTVSEMLLGSWEIYESYTAPLGVGWMVNPNHHYGPNVDGYEYSKWGTYHFADCRGIGVDRTAATGTGYTSQYHSPQSDRYESLTECPDELLLFFHHVPYTHVLKSGKTVIQHIYDSRFEGAERAAELLRRWDALEGLVDAEIHKQARDRFVHQAEHAQEWRDVINTYFYRKSGIPDAHGRTIY
ncbi:alpha-glucuronidase family glycosyl hydrolase [Paenibacillus sp.]|uniref:alpha-glucuronidase family glycosyl hydrolase n=1 Tax=Paenibacillus sp. TaxID=58172 RepID=UPI002D2C559B|nr:alpha-glucuronidase family glycosyl hydrolase [Paenibacillus sp.]HZG86307.1 alpha-glucuronidase family glycosyl hydrolase [Paenibacillus sp.]